MSLDIREPHLRVCTSIIEVCDVYMYSSVRITTRETGKCSLLAYAKF